MSTIVLMYFYVYKSWQRAKQVWSAGRIWPTGRHLRRPAIYINKRSCIINDKVAIALYLLYKQDKMLNMATSNLLPL